MSGKNLTRNSPLCCFSVSLSFSLDKRSSRFNDAFLSAYKVIHRGGGEGSRAEGEGEGIGKHR